MSTALPERGLFSAIDMPFEQSVHDTLETLTQMIQTRQYRRLILLVDIGSLIISAVRSVGYSR